MNRISFFSLCALAVAAGAARGDANWTQFRGPSAGVVEGAALPDKWSTSDNVAWVTPVPGRGWASPIVWGDRIFLTSVVSDGKPEPPKKGLYFGGNQYKAPKEKHRWVVLAVDGKTGKLLWEKSAHEAVPSTAVHIKNTYASETPVTDGERLYAYFGNVGVFCYDLDGKELWSQKYKSYKTRFSWGTAASPVLHKDRLYIVNDNDENSFLVALDKRTGKEVWRVERDEKSNWATPYVWENELRTEIVTPGTGKVRSYDLDGKLLWEFQGMSSIAIPTPFAKHGLLYISSGYVLDPVRPLYAIRPGAKGDISLKKGETSNQSIAWHHRQGGPYNPTPIVYGDFLYVLYDRGFLACYDAKTGKQVYEQQRLSPEATAFTASPWACDGKIFCLSEDGDTFVVQAGPQFKLLGKNSLDEMCMATPAVLGDSLIVRTLTKLYRIEKGAKLTQK